MATSVPRPEILRRVVKLVGENILTVVDPAKGWPAIARIRLSDGIVPVALHVGPIVLSHRERDDVERRFQNPGQGKPIQAPGDSMPLLVGVWQESSYRPVLVAMDAARRVGRETRQSLFIPLRLLVETARQGWGEHVSGSGERIFAFHPPLLPTYVEMVRRGVEAHVSTDQMVDVLGASGLADDEEETPVERARRASMSLVRDESFRKEVVDAYEGLCALCGFDLDLVEGAHIYPARATGSPDKVWNGVALCRNHHAAFDRHVIWIEPASRSVRLHERITRNASRNDSCRFFLESTRRELAEPVRPVARPRDNMFVKRYSFFEGSYDWAAA